MVRTACSPAPARLSAADAAALPGESAAEEPDGVPVPSRGEEGPEVGWEGVEADMGYHLRLTAEARRAQASRREKTNQAAMSGMSAQAAKTAMAWPWVRNWAPCPPHSVMRWNGSETASETVLGRQPMIL